MVKAMPRTPRNIRWTVRRPDCLEVGRSTCVMSPVTNGLRAGSRCESGTFFHLFVGRVCASSKITKESLSERPRMKASGATSITFAFDQLGHALEPIISYSASYMGRRYGSTFCVKSPGRKPKRSPASTAGRTSTMRLTFFRLQRLDGTGHGKIRLARARRADAEGQVVSSDIIEVFGFDWRRGRVPRAAVCTLKLVRIPHWGRQCCCPYQFLQRNMYAARNPRARAARG